LLGKIITDSGFKRRISLTKSSIDGFIVCPPLITISALKSLNNLTSDNLSIGQVLKISGSSTNAPAETTENVYTVKAGDSLWSIANKYGITVDKLKSMNNLSSNIITVGQRLLVKDTSSSEDVGVYYTVNKGDTLYVEPSGICTPGIS